MQTQSDIYPLKQPGCATWLPRQSHLTDSCPVDIFPMIKWLMDMDSICTRDKKKIDYFRD